MFKFNDTSSLDDFIDYLCDVSILSEFPFSELYPCHFNDISNALKKEIINNLTSLSNEQFHIYLDYVNEEIQKAYSYDPEKCLIEKWISVFHLKENDFPFYENKEITFFTSIIIDDSSLSLEEKKVAKSIQLEFYWHAVFLEYVKINEFIDSLTKGSIASTSGNILAKSKIITKTKTVSEKLHALLYLLELESQGLKPPVNNEGSFIRSEIEEIGQKRIGSTGQSFYRHVISNIEVINDNAKLIARFGSDWKKSIIDLSEENIELKKHLDKSY